MNSSISSSDHLSQWNRWLVILACTIAVGTSLLFVLMIMVDPYDSGRFGFLGIEGINDWNQRTANASRARDPRFDSAVIGNSHGQIISPAALSRSTGAHFVQLTVPATSSREQLAILDFFLRHHPRVEGLVIITDEVWCTHDPALPPAASFPFWLYGDSTLDYASRLLSWRAIGHSFQRIMIGLGLRHRSDPDGFSDYEESKIRDRHPDDVEQNLPSSSAGTGIASNFFPAVRLLERVISRLPASVPIVLVIPPTFYTAIPQPGSIEAAERNGCNTALKSVVAGRLNSNFINYSVDNALTRDRMNFVDVSHYRAKVARKMEEGIAASIRSGEAARIDF
jgi:hypothetical protein